MSLYFQNTVSFIKLEINKILEINKYLCMFLLRENAITDN